METGTMKIMKCLAVAALTCALAAPAIAQGSPPTPEERAARFDAADKDKDGKMSKAEFVDMLPALAKGRGDTMWARIDPTGKGAVTKAEFLATPPIQRPG